MVQTRVRRNLGHLGGAHNGAFDLDLGDILNLDLGIVEISIDPGEPLAEMLHDIHLAVRRLGMRNCICVHLVLHVQSPLSPGLLGSMGEQLMQFRCCGRRGQTEVYQHNMVLKLVETGLSEERLIGTSSHALVLRSVRLGIVHLREPRLEMLNGGLVAVLSTADLCSVLPPRHSSQHSHPLVPCTHRSVGEQVSHLSGCGLHGLTKGNVGVCGRVFNVGEPNLLVLLDQSMRCGGGRWLVLCPCGERGGGHVGFVHLWEPLFQLLEGMLVVISSLGLNRHLGELDRAHLDHHPAPVVPCAECSVGELCVELTSSLNDGRCSSLVGQTQDNGPVLKHCKRVPLSVRLVM